MRKRLDDTRPEPSFYLSKEAIRSAKPIVADRKLPICPCGVILDGYPTITLVVGESMLQSIYDKLRDDQPEALCLTRSRRSSVATYLERDWSSIANHRRCERLTQL